MWSTECRKSVLNCSTLFSQAHCSKVPLVLWSQYEKTKKQKQTQQTRRKTIADIQTVNLIIRLLSHFCSCVCKSKNFWCGATGTGGLTSEHCSGKKRSKKINEINLAQEFCEMIYRNSDRESSFDRTVETRPLGSLWAGGALTRNKCLKCWRCRGKHVLLLVEHFRLGTRGRMECDGAETDPTRRGGFLESN